MRSRYTAYTQANVDYIARTMRDRALVHFDHQEARTWARSVKWLRLEVLKSGVDGATGFVEFRAYYSYRNQMQVMHELSEFRLEAGQWYYIGEKNTH
jgi:SEC-C motif-containing protein